MYTWAEVHQKLFAKKHKTYTYSKPVANEDNDRHVLEDCIFI